jgi:hypothetical protein
MADCVKEALTELSPNDIVVIHCFDNVAFMARSEEGGDLPIRRYCDGEYHIEGELVVASKERLYMFFRNCLPVFNLLEGRIVFFLTPMPRYLYVNCCVRADHAPNRLEDSFEENIRKSLADCRSFYKDFLFTSGLKHFNIVNPGICVPQEDEEGNQLWGPDPVHPRHEGYGRIVDYICSEAAKLQNKDDTKKRQGEPLGPPPKRQHLAIQRPKWVADVPTNIMVQGGGNRGQSPARGRGHWRGNNFMRGRGGGQPRGQPYGQGYGRF